MRLDKFLKVSRILKRRTIAVEACKGGIVCINDKQAKPSVQLKIGDVVSIKFASKILTFEVLSLDEKTKKDSLPIYKIIEE